jgi:MoaA/NifB/PqqE/SkfB family radical SAM enzyme
MFESQQLKSIEFELANKCNARCPQCPRYSQGKLIPNLNKNELTLADIQQSIAEQTIANLDEVIFKGTTGDPIIAKDFLSIVKHFKSINANIKVWIATNGSMYNSTYWQTLADMLNPNDKVVFGIDGLADTHHLYRVGTDFHTVLSNAKSFIHAGGNAHWQFIKFAHNEHQWSDCEKLSQELGFTNFITLHSDRNFEESHLNPPTDQLDVQPTGCVSCMSANKREVFVYADGTVYPCCFLGGIHTWSKNNVAALDYGMLTNMTDPTVQKIPQHSLESIIDSDQFQNFSQIFNTPLRICKKYCS